ncbi:MAG: CBS domain-containing protein [Alphaproteobacteria bacterium]|jgi:CBS domain-containing protein|nr:CBS domain-containing protein [Alphaproteobacteria bacterium]
MTIRAILQGKSQDIISIAADAYVADAVALLAEKRIGALPVLEDGRIVGIFSERDVIYCLASAGADAVGKTVGEVMTSPAVDTTRDMPVLSALSLMTRRRIRHLPVVESGKLIGFVSIGDLVKYRIERIESEASALRDYIQS